MFRKLARKLVPVAWLAPGFLLWIAFPPYGEKIEVFFALAPLMWFSRNRPAGKSFKLWFLNGLVFWAGTLSWMPAIVKNGGPWPLVALGWAGLSAYCSLYFAAFGALSSYAWKWTREPESGIGPRMNCWFRYSVRMVLILVAEPVLWAGFEIARSRLFGGFAWNQLGVASAMMGFTAPLALGGVYLAGAMAVLVNGTIASIAERILSPRFGSVPRQARFLETALPFAAVFAIWAASPSPASVRGETRTVVAGLVQRNFPCVFKPGETENPVEVYRTLSSGLSFSRPDIVVCPESAFAEFGGIDGGGARNLAAMIAAESGAKAVLAGGARTDGGKLYNSAALYCGESVQVYDKVHLVPFGEYIPGDKLIPSLQSLAPVGSCSPGELKLLDFDGLKLGVAICFEDTDSAQMRKLAGMGANALVFITNDSWFSESAEAVQHQWQAVSRAVETGLPVVRVGNSGVTGTISPDGSGVWLSRNGKPAVDVRGTMADGIAVPVAPAATPYVRCGDTPLFGAFCLVALAIAACGFASRRGLL